LASTVTARYRIRRDDTLDIPMTSRRAFLEQGTLAAVSLTLPARAGAAMTAPASFLDLLRPPDALTVQSADAYLPLASAGGRWEGAGVAVSVDQVPGAMRVRLSAPGTPVKRLHLRWRGSLAGTRLLLGDAWERGYGDLEWRGFVPDRVMPWYVAAWDGHVTHAYGVRTNPGAMCFWQADPQGLSLWADVRSGGAALELGDRTLAVCDVVCRAGRPDETPFAALHTFCRQMCPGPLMPAQPVYGTNDWYWAYGNNSAASVLADAGHVAELSPSGANRPYAVIDDGWQPERGAAQQGVGLWDRGNERFPDLPGLADAMQRAGARPGIWMRPLLAPADAPDTWRLPRERAVLDPTIPEVRAKVAADVGRLRAWGFRLIKHDYSTFDLLGRWGFAFGAALTKEGWTFAEGPQRTTAEVIGALYDTIRAAAGDALVLGCNTVSHLSAGRFALCRTGDDTSGTEWARTRKMGVNTLAFRAVQHGAFYAADPDCVGVTTVVPWSLNRQWLDLVARSGTVLFASLAPDALGAEQRRDLQAAFALAARPQPLGEPQDWQETVWPARWRLLHEARAYDWLGPDGVATVP
jgi:alpha-galactosidase